MDQPNSPEDKRAELRRAALEYHEKPVPGKVAIAATKQLTNQRDLALAYSPGVAAPCEEIVADPNNAFRYTSRGNLVAVITNGTAVLGLGDIGPLAAKPVMEGKGVLFKKFSGIDVFDIEINEKDPDKLVEIIAALEPTFGGINLEDIKAPDCFYVERKLRERMKIPVFHDDQHGTAIVVGAALLNGLKVVGKDIKQVKLVTSGAGAAALACIQLLVKLGLPRENIWVTDLAGLVYEGRTELMDPDKAVFAQKTEQRTLAEAIAGADVFLGLSAGGVLKPDMVAKMAAQPLIFALANPTPEILPEQVKAVRDDAIMATGRTDYPNQVNNVLCFPYIFRGALDAGASTITDEMEIAAVHAIAELAQAEQNEVVAAAYAGEKLAFGPEYLIPKPFDPRLMIKIAPAVAQAAVDSGVALRPVADMEAYRQRLQSFVFASGTIMKPIYAAAKTALMLPGRQVFLVDTHINYDPSAQQIAAITQMAARKIMRFGITPKAALLSHSNFGSSNQPSAVKMREALAILRAEAPWLEVDGEMHGDVALDAEARVALMPRTTLAGDANLLVCPNIDAANIAYNLLKTAAGGNIAIGPMLLGVARPAHILTASATVRRIVNMTALTVAEANVHR